MEIINFDEMLKELNELKLTQCKYDWVEDLPDSLYQKYFDNTDYEEVLTGLDIETHRWYEKSISVYKFNDRYLGVNSITNIFSESSSPEDMYETIEFFEMEPIQVTSYKIKE
jgi:hypothetical protein